LFLFNCDHDRDHDRDRDAEYDHDRDAGYDRDHGADYDCDEVELQKYGCWVVVGCWIVGCWIVGCWKWRRRRYQQDQQWMVVYSLFLPPYSAVLPSPTPGCSL
jgi:hypothetical protein